MNDQPQLWTPAEFAQFAKLTPAQVSHLRKRGGGPPFTKLGRQVRYVPGAVRSWVIENQKTTAKEAKK